MAALSLCSSAVSAAILSGFVRDAQSGEPLAYAAVCLTVPSCGTASGKDGYYVLRGVAGQVVVEFSAVGYQPSVCTLALGTAGARRLDVRLTRDPIRLPTVTTSAARERFRREIDLGVRRLDLRDIKLVPALVDPDLFRSFQSLPGVVSVSDFSSALYVRGGSPDQNAILLDGVPMFNPYHLSGLFSTFNVDALSGAELHAGAFPAEFGGAVSSVLDVTTRSGNSERFGGKWDVGLLTSRAVFEGPLPRGSFLVAGRRAYTDVATAVMARVTKDSSFSLPYYFYELQGRLNFDLSSRDKLSLSGFVGRDRIDTVETYDTVDFQWGNRMLALRWNHILAPGLVLAAQAGHGASDASLHIRYDSLWQEYPHDDRFVSTTGSSGARGWVEFTPDSLHAWRGGVETSVYDVSSLRAGDTTVYRQLEAKPMLVALHVDDQWRPNSRFLVRPGVRSEFFSSGRYVRFSSRLSVKWFVRKDFAVSAGVGRYNQYLSIPFPRDELLVRAPALFFQQVMPADSVLPPAWSDNLALGAEKWLSSGLQLSAEAYYKRMGNLLEIDLDYDPSNDPDFNPLNLNPLYLSGRYSRVVAGTGRAAGLELLLRHQLGWVGYGLAVTRRRFLGDEFYPVFDARHSINVASNIGLGRGWSLALQWTFRTGFPDGGPVSWFQEVTVDPRTGRHYFWWSPIRAEGLRYPAYHRLDGGIEKRFRLLGLELTGYLQVINVYARHNALWYTYYEGGRKPFVLVPVPIPSLGLRGSF